MRIICKLRNSCPKVLDRNSCSESFGTFSGKHSSWGPNLTQLRNEGLKSDFKSVDPEYIFCWQSVV